MSNPYDTMDSKPTRLLCPWGSPGKNTGVGCHFLLQEIFPTQELTPGLLHCKAMECWLRGRESTANSGDTGSIPAPGRSHMPDSNKAHVPQLRRLCSTTREDTTMRSPCTAQSSSALYNSPRAAMKIQHSQK